MMRYSAIIRFVGYFAIAGLVIPCLFAVTWALLENSPDLYKRIGGSLEKMQLLAWPTSIFMIATAGQEGFGYKMFSISLAANILLYSLLGFLFWLGIYRYRWVLYLIGPAIVLGWYKLLRL